jgi:hypothetical protein
LIRGQNSSLSVAQSKKPVGSVLLLESQEAQELLLRILHWKNSADAVPSRQYDGSVSSAAAANEAREERTRVSNVTFMVVLMSVM